MKKSLTLLVALSIGATLCFSQTTTTYTRSLRYATADADSANFATQNLWWWGSNNYYRFSEDGVKYSLKSYVSTVFPLLSGSFWNKSGITKLTGDVYIYPSNLSHSIVIGKNSASDSLAASVIVNAQVVNFDGEQASTINSDDELTLNGTNAVNITSDVAVNIPNLFNNNNVDSLLAIDDLGKIYWRDAATLGGSGWSTNGETDLTGSVSIDGNGTHDLIIGYNGVTTVGHELSSFEVHTLGDVAFNSAGTTSVRTSGSGVATLSLSKPTGGVGTISTSIYQNSVSTTDATQTTLHTIAVPASQCLFIRAFVVGRRTGGVAGTAEDCAAYEVKALYKNVAGTATLVGSVFTHLTVESQAGWDCTFTVSGGNVLVRVTGATDNNVSWQLCELRASSVGTN
jgi:microcystin-dependent protein